MTRAILTSCVALLVCAGLGDIAWAGKPKIAILGLEAAPGPSGAVDPATTQVAKDVTRELRQRAQAGASPYVIAPNSNKELTDEKLLMSCDNEKADCMAVIGAGLAADMLLYGRVERKGEVYRISLKLLDVKAKTIETSTDEAAVGGAVAGVSKRLYVKLIGDGPGGNGALLVRARAQSGGELRGARVMVDEDGKGELSGGKLTVTGVAEGRHTVAIEASGYSRFEEIVTVHGGEQVRIDAVLLDRSPGTTPPPAEGRSSFWKYTFWSSVVVGVAGGALAGYGYYAETRTITVTPRPGKDPMDQSGVSVDDCGRKNDTTALANERMVDFDTGAFRHACTWHTWHLVGWGVGIAGGVGAIVSLVQILRAPSDAEHAANGRARKSEVALVPILGRDVGGASLSLTW